MKGKVSKMVSIFYTDGATYIENLLHDDRNIMTTEMGILEAIMLSIKLDCNFDMDFSSETYKEYARKEALTIFNMDNEELANNKDFGKLIFKIITLFEIKQL